MSQSGRLAAAVAGAAGVSLSLLAVGLANMSGRDLDALRVSAKRSPADVQVALGLTGPTTMARAFCFDPLRPPSLETMALINQVMEQQAGGGLDYQLGAGTWPGIPGGTLTWSFVPDGTQVPNLSGSSFTGSTLFASMDAKFGGNRALWISKFQSVFDRWEAISGLKYQRVTNNGNEWDDGASFPNAGASNTAGATRGAVRISMRALDGSNGVLAYNWYPTTGDMVIDSAESWQSSSGDYRYLRNTVSHEHGHGMGLAHCCPGNGSKLMEPLLNTGFDGPQLDDVRGSHAKYGDFHEPNNNSVQAKDLGTIAFGSTVNPSTVSPAISNTTRTSIHTLSDQDWFKFTVTAAAQINVTLTPRGTNYLNGPQNSNGSCSTGVAQNALAAGDINLAVIGTNGSTVLQQATPAAAGSAESITGLILPAAGTYYIRVNGSSLSSVQLYELSMQVNTGNACPSFTTHPISQTVCLNAPLVLSVGVTGAPAPTLQWKKNNVNIPGETGPTLTIPSANEQTQGTYTCVATNNCGSQTSNPAVITVPSAVTITQQPQSISVPEGSPATLSVAATGTGVQYQWFKDFAPVAGANSAEYHIAAVTFDDDGTYYCQVNNVCSFVNSTSVMLTVTTPVACYANCDLSTQEPVLNVADFSCFLSQFASGSTYANCDGSTQVPTLNVADFSCFLTKFAAGCP